MNVLTYLDFHVWVILPPILLLAVAAWRRDTAWWDRQALTGMAIIVVLALLYTIPWDSYLIQRGVWSYPADVVTGQFLSIPPGEYLFFILQPILTALWLFQIIDVEDYSLSIPIRSRLVGVLGGLIISGAGVWLLQSTQAFYLGAILAWAGPILAIQWGFGWPYLVARWRLYLLGVGVPTIYLWTTDWLAIVRWNLWSFNETMLIGIRLAGLPIEELTFFLLTNVFVVQGLVLWMWLLDQLGRLRHSTEYVPRPTQFGSTD